MGRCVDLSLGHANFQTSQTHRTPSICQMGLRPTLTSDLDIRSLREQCNEDSLDVDPTVPKLADWFSPTQLLAKFNDLYLTFADFEAVRISLNRDHMSGAVWAESDVFASQLLKSRDWLDGKGGYLADGRLCVEVCATGRPIFYVGPSGGDYGRYVARLG